MIISGRKSPIAASIVSAFKISPIYALALSLSNFSLPLSDVVNPATSCPSSTKRFVNRVPINPVAPVINILVIIVLTFLFLFF